MRSDLDQLPAAKQRDLRWALDVLFSTFDEALKGELSPERKQGRILKVVLYGSQARGTAVRDPAGGYISDYDLLVVVNGEEFTDVADYWEGAEDRFLRRSLINPMRHPIQFIVHSLSDVNDQLARGRDFFMDILREGIVLYEAEATPSSSPSRCRPRRRMRKRRAISIIGFQAPVSFSMTSRAIETKGVSTKQRSNFTKRPSVCITARCWC